MIPRKIESKLIKYLDNFKIVVVSGARQTGKSTLVKYIAGKRGLNYVSFDTAKYRNLASSDTEVFLKQQQPPIAIDEVQKVPQIIEEIKYIADNSPGNGQFLLTGSVDLLASPRIKESLTGRVAFIELFPFATSELKNREYNLIDCLFDKTIFDWISSYDINIEKIADTLWHGRFPVPMTLDREMTFSWFETYIRTRVLKDFNDLTQKSLHKAYTVERLIELLSYQTASLLNVSNIAKDLKVHPMTAKNYIYYLEKLFIIKQLRPFYRNIGKQVTKKTKLYFIDTGLAANMLGLSVEQLLEKGKAFGQLLENFIYLELIKEMSFSSQQYKIYYYRDDKANEIDFIIKNRFGKFIAIEVKSKSVVKPADLVGIKSFYNRYGKDLLYAYVFFGGSEVSALKLGDLTVYLLPYAALF